MRCLRDGIAQAGTEFAGEQCERVTGKPSAVGVVAFDVEIDAVEAKAFGLVHERRHEAGTRCRVGEINLPEAVMPRSDGARKLRAGIEFCFLGGSCRLLVS